MARVTVEDCIDKVDSPYELVLVAKERATQLNSGIEPTLERDNDKNTVIALREIAEEKIKVPDLTENAVYKLRKHVEQIDDGSEDDEDVGDDFESLYKGEISKSGTPILPSKRARKTPEKIQVSQDDLAELSETTKPDVENTAGNEKGSEEVDLSLDQVSEAEEQASETGGYANQASEAFLAAQRKQLSDQLSEADVAICTAQVPGKKAPILIKPP